MAGTTTNVPFYPTDLRPGSTTYVLIKLWIMIRKDQFSMVWLLISGVPTFSNTVNSEEEGNLHNFDIDILNIFITDC